MMRNSGTADAAVGMMDAAYFTGRKELLDFFNELLELNLSKIEQTASGAVACQLTEYIFPGSIPMSRVNWEAKSDYEFIQNYKLLQSAFNKHKVQRHVDVDKLIRAKYQDNLEFCQWLKAFFDQAGVYRDDYDPVAVRKKGKGGKKLAGTGRSASTRSTMSTSSARSLTSSTRSMNSVNRGSTSSNRSKPKPTRSKPTSRSQKENTDNNLVSRSNTSAASISSSALTEAVLADATLMKKNADLEKRVQELETTAVEVEKERDFYFEKLRSVEVLLQVHQERGAASDPDDMVERVFKVLYATAEDNIAVGDDGEFLNEDGLNEYGLAEEETALEDDAAFEEALNG